MDFQRLAGIGGLGFATSVSTDWRFRILFAAGAYRRLHRGQDGGQFVAPAGLTM